MTTRTTRRQSLWNGLTAFSIGSGSTTRLPSQKWLSTRSNPPWMLTSSRLSYVSSRVFSLSFSHSHPLPFFPFVFPLFFLSLHYSRAAWVDILSSRQPCCIGPICRPSSSSASLTLALRRPTCSISVWSMGMTHATWSSTLILTGTGIARSRSTPTPVWACPRFRSCMIHEVSSTFLFRKYFLRCGTFFEKIFENVHKINFARMTPAELRIGLCS